MAEVNITRDQLADFLNEDLSREYQAIIAYVVYSQVLKGAEYMSIAEQLEEHSGAAACAHHLAADRLSRQDADGDAEAGQGFGGRARHAALRPRQ